MSKWAGSSCCSQVEPGKRLHRGEHVTPHASGVRRPTNRSPNDPSRMMCRKVAKLCPRISSRWATNSSESTRFRPASEAADSRGRPRRSCRYRWPSPPGCASAREFPVRPSARPRSPAGSRYGRTSSVASSSRQIHRPASLPRPAPDPTDRVAWRRPGRRARRRDLPSTHRRWRQRCPADDPARQPTSRTFHSSAIEQRRPRQVRRADVGGRESCCAVKQPRLGVQAGRAGSRRRPSPAHPTSTRRSNALRSVAPM